jgi:hypothetical protein
VNEDSILAVQVFDQKKFKKKDQGFLGVINIRIGDIIELAPDADGIHSSHRSSLFYIVADNVYSQIRCSPVT